MTRKTIIAVVICVLGGAVVAIVLSWMPKGKSTLVGTGSFRVEKPKRDAGMPQSSPAPEIVTSGNAEEVAAIAAIAAIAASQAAPAASRWDDGPFTSDPNELQDVLMKATLGSGTSLSEEMAITLRYTTLEMMTTFMDGSYEAYERFAKKVPVKYPKLFKDAQETLKQRGIVLDEDQVAREVHKSWYKEQAPWTGIGQDSIKISVFESQRPRPLNKEPSLEFMPTRQGMVFQPEPVWRPEWRVEDEIRSTGRIVYADIYFIVRHAPPDPVYPEYVRFRWHSEAKAWVVDQAARLQSNDRTWVVRF